MQGNIPGAALPPLPASDPAGSDAWFLALWSAFLKEEADLEAALEGVALDDTRGDALITACGERRALLADLVRRAPASGLAGALVKARMLLSNSDINGDGTRTISRATAYLPKRPGDTASPMMAASLWADLEALAEGAGIPAYEGVLSVADLAAREGGAA